MRFSVLLCLLFIFPRVTARDEKGIHYIGGMYYGKGFHHFATPMINKSILTNYVGGRLAFSLGKNFRAGIMGGNIFKYYDSNTSHYKLGHGGITGEYVLKRNRFAAGAGLMLGGGKYRNLYVSELSGNTLNGYYREASFMFVVPFVTASLSLTNKLSLSLMAEHFNDALFTEKAGLSGTNIKFGILFNR